MTSALSEKKKKNRGTIFYRLNNRRLVTFVDKFQDLFALLGVPHNQ